MVVNDTQPFIDEEVRSDQTARASETPSPSSTFHITVPCLRVGSALGPR